VEPSPPPTADPVNDAENMMFSREVVNTILFFMIALACIAIICVCLAHTAGYFGTIEGYKGMEGSLLGGKKRAG